MVDTAQDAIDSEEDDADGAEDVDRTEDAIAVCLDVPALRDRLLCRLELLEEGPSLHGMLSELARLAATLLAESPGDRRLEECIWAVEGLLALDDPYVTEMTLCAFGDARVELPDLVPLEILESLEAAWE